MDAQIVLYRQWPPMRRLQMAWQLYQLAKSIIRTREQRRHPSMTAEALEQRVRSFFLR